MNRVFISLLTAAASAASIQPAMWFTVNPDPAALCVTKADGTYVKPFVMATADGKVMPINTVDLIKEHSGQKEFCKSVAGFPISL